MYAKPGSYHINVTDYSIRGCLKFSFNILFMFVVHTNLKLFISVNAIVLDLCKITNLRKKQLKVETLHNLKEF